MTTPSTSPPFDPLRPVGVFLIGFGLLVAAAPIAPFVKPLPAADLVIDVMAGLVIAGIGAAFYFVGRRRGSTGR
jgi:hypothetical protein